MLSLLNDLKYALGYKSAVAFALACPYFFLTILSVLGLVIYLASLRLPRSSEVRVVLALPLQIFGGTWTGATFLLLVYEVFVSICMRYALHRPLYTCGRHHNRLCPPYPFPLWDHTLKHVLQIGTVMMGAFLIAVSVAIVGWGVWSGIRAGIRVAMARGRAAVRAARGQDPEDPDEDGSDD